MFDVQAAEAGFGLDVGGHGILSCPEATIGHVDGLFVEESTFEDWQWIYHPGLVDAFAEHFDLVSIPKAGRFSRRDRSFHIRCPPA